jgi:hypothetical protein
VNAAKFACLTCPSFRPDGLGLSRLTVPLSACAASAQLAIVCPVHSVEGPVSDGATAAYRCIENVC